MITKGFTYIWKAFEWAIVIIGVLYCLAGILIMITQVVWVGLWLTGVV